ncbi:hypothetical protein D3C86_1856400 [compost metagenome]
MLTGGTLRSTGYDDLVKTDIIGRQLPIYRYLCSGTQLNCLALRFITDGGEYNLVTARGQIGSKAKLTLAIGSHCEAGILYFNHYPWNPGTGRTFGYFTCNGVAFVLRICHLGKNQQKDRHPENQPDFAAP